MTPGSLVAGGFPAGSLITPSGMSPLVLTGMQCGFLSSFALLSACNEAGPSVWGTCSEG